MRTNNNLIFSTFIGLEIEVVHSSCRDFIGIKGRVVDETKNTLIIETFDGNEKKIPKISCTFRFTLEDGKKKEIEGKKMTFRPEERPKKV